MDQDVPPPPPPPTRTSPLPPKPKANPKPRRTAKPASRAEVNRQNSQKSTGPRTPEGKASAAQNSLKSGFFANVENLHPQDAPTFINLLSDLRQGLHPDGPVEDLLVRELAMLQSRLQRLESIEYALLMGNIDAPPLPGDCLVCPSAEQNSSPTNPTAPGACGQTGLSPTSSNQRDLYTRDPFNNNQPLDFSFDSRDLASAFITASPHLDSLHRAETHLRRAYNRTFDRLQRMQKDRRKAPQPGMGGSNKGTGESVVRGQEESTGRPEGLPKVSSVVRGQGINTKRTHPIPTLQKQRPKHQQEILHHLNQLADKYDPKAPDDNPSND